MKGALAKVPDHRTPTFNRDGGRSRMARCARTSPMVRVIVRLSAKSLGAPAGHYDSRPVYQTGRIWQDWKTGLLSFICGFHYPATT